MVEESIIIRIRAIDEATQKIEQVATSLKQFQVKIPKIEIKGLEKLQLEKDQKAETVIIKTNSKSFISGNINMKVSYTDEFDRQFSKDKSFEITIYNLPWYARILSLFYNLF